MKNSKRIAILQPLIPHYRMEFFTRLNNNIPTDVFVYDKDNKEYFNLSSYKVKTLPCIKIKGVLLYLPFVFMHKQYTSIVCMLHFAHITTWILLLLNMIFHRKQIILWGHGISVKRYLAEEKKCNWLLRFMISMSDGVWLYTDKEVDLWKKEFPHKSIISLNNTISGIDKIVKYVSPLSRTDLQRKYGIKEEFIFLFCARFNSPYRRIDLLLNAINKLDNKKNAFIIIGDGNNKPDFSNYKNVYDIGETYDRNIKNDLFSLANVYFQPGWVGLSIVEAMAYGLPIFTFKRSENIKQCVEYSYIKNGFNGLIFNDVDDFIYKVNNISISEINKMGVNAKNYVRNNLSMQNMVESALSIL